MNETGNNGMEGDWEAQLADYALGVMEPSAAAEFERRLNECRSHVVLSEQYDGVIAMLGHAAPSAAPPEGHKSRFLARLNATPQSAQTAAVPVARPSPTLVRPPAMPVSPSPQQGAAAAGDPRTPGRVVDLTEYRERRRAPSALPAIAAVAAVLLLFAAGWGWYRALSSENEVIGLNERLRDAAASINIPPGASVFPILGQGEEADAAAVGVVEPGTNKVYLVGRGLRVLSPDEVYELWLIPPPDTNRRPVAAGVFNADAAGKVEISTVAPEPMASYALLAVTIEPAPGVEQSVTGNVVLSGTVKLSQ